MITCFTRHSNHIAPHQSNLYWLSAALGIWSLAYLGVWTSTLAVGSEDCWASVYHIPLSNRVTTATRSTVEKVPLKSAIPARRQQAVSIARLALEAAVGDWVAGIGRLTCNVSKEEFSLSRNMDWMVSTSETVSPCTVMTKRTDSSLSECQIISPYAGKQSCSVYEQVT